MYKLTAPTDNTARHGGHLDYFWTVLGIAYVERLDIAEHLAARGYTVEEVDEVPAEHEARVARLEAWPWPITVGQADGADPEHRYRFTDPDGTHHDIRDLLSGALTAVASHSVNTGLVPRLDEAKRVAPRPDTTPNA